MFGRNKANQEELEKLKQTLQMDDAFFEKVEEKKDMFDATASELEGSRRQADADMEQIRQNISNVSELALGNVEMENALSASFQELSAKAEGMERKQEEVRDHFREVLEKTTELVDANKHFTSPSKYLNEVPARLRARNKDSGRQLDQMEEYGKQMGVLALDAAIEAGRLGESGKQFVTSAEAIRSYASNYDQVIASARKQLTDSEAEVQRLEEEVHRLVALLKENNIAAARLMKTCGDVVREADQAGAATIVGELQAMMDQVTVLKNADDEIVKSEERNRMQMEDLTEEFDSQTKNQKEMAQMVDPFFRHLVERKADREE